MGAKVRINTNLVRGGIETPYDAINMIEVAKNLGADEIRFAELQNQPGFYVPAAAVLKDDFPALHTDPFTDGCEQTLLDHDGFKVIARQTCGIVNEARPPVPRPVQKGAQTKVLYTNGEVYDGWRLDPFKAAEVIVKELCGKPCHATTGCYGQRGRKSATGCH